MTTDIVTASDLQTALQSDQLVVIDYYADWCAPCMQLAAKYDLLSEQYTAASFYRVNVDEFLTPENEPLIKGLVPPITGLPSIFLYKNRDLVDTVKEADDQVLKQAIDRWI